MEPPAYGERAIAITDTAQQGLLALCASSRPSSTLEAASKSREAQLAAQQIITTSLESVHALLAEAEAQSAPENELKALRTIATKLQRMHRYATCPMWDAALRNEEDAIQFVANEHDAMKV